MCPTRQKCERPGQLKGQPAACSPEQIKKCHGDPKRHPCAKKAD